MAFGITPEHVASVIGFIHQLYPPSTGPQIVLSPGDQHRVQALLTDAQKSEEAWGLPFYLLAEEDPSVRFFGAHTIQVKISRDWDTLPAEHHTTLKQSLLDWIATSARLAHPADPATAPRNGEKIVLRKLAVAVTSLSLRLAPHIWSNWLLEVISALSSGPGLGGGSTSSGCSREGVLEVLSIVVDEVDRADLTGKRRVQYESTIHDSQPIVARTIADSLSAEPPQSANPPIRGREVSGALKCLESWTRTNNLSNDLIGTLYTLLLPYLLVPDTCPDACSCVDDLMARKFITRTRSDELFGLFENQWVRSLFSEAEATGDVDDATLALFKLLISLVEHATDLLVSTVSSPRSILILKQLLSLSSLPGYFGVDEDISNIGLDVWEMLQEGIIDSVGEDGEDPIPGKTDAKQIWAIAKDVFGALVPALRRKVQWPPEDTLRTWPKDVKEKFRVYRSRVAEALLQAYVILRQEMLGSLVEVAVTQHSTPRHAGSGWEDLEATLFCIRSIQEAVPPGEDTHLARLFGPEVIGRLPNTGSGVRSVQTTALGLIGAYASWFKEHPAHILAGLNYVIAGLSDPNLCVSAAPALKQLCDACRGLLGEHTGSFVGLLRSSQGSIPDALYAKVLQSVASVVQALPPEQIVEPLAALMEPPVMGLARSCEMFSSLPVEARELCIQQLQFINGCARGLSEPDDDVFALEAPDPENDPLSRKIDVLLQSPPMQAMKHSLNAAFGRVLAIWSSDFEVVNELNEVLRTILASSVPSPLLPNTVSLLTDVSSSLRPPPSPILLSVQALLITQIARDRKDAQSNEAIRLAFERSCQIALQVLPEVHDMVQDPDLTMAILHLSDTVMRYRVEVIASSPQLLEALFHAASRGLVIQERLTLQSAISLLMSFVQQSQEACLHSEVFRALTLTYGSNLVGSLIFCIGGGSPRTSLPYLSELLHTITTRFPQESRTWLKECMAKDGFPSTRTTQASKDKFLKAAVAARTTKKVNEAANEFAIVARGLEGSAYGAASVGLGSL